MASAVSADLTLIRRKLHDAGVLWPDAELLRWYRSGYTELLGRTGAVRRWVPLDAPGRHTYALTFDWEDAYVTGSVWVPFLAAAPSGWRVTVRWEAQHLEGVTPSASLAALTQQWERAHLDSTDRRYRFTFPRSHQRPVRLMWQNRRLTPVAVRELDDFETAWEQQSGEPRAWTPGLGRARSVELFEIQTEYQQAYHLVDGEHGILRRLSGSRTYAASSEPTHPLNTYAYTTDGDAEALRQAAAAFIVGLGAKITTPSAAPIYEATQPWEPEVLAGATTFTAGVVRGAYVWEHQHGAAAMVLALGLARRLTSPDRQYLPIPSDLAMEPTYAGRILDVRSSEDSVFALEEVVPQEDVGTADIPQLIPTPVRKYLRYYVWSQAFARPGEGRNLILADHYGRRFQHGVALLRRLADPTHRDRLMQRESVTLGAPSRPPRVRLPSTFPAVDV